MTADLVAFAENAGVNYHAKTFRRALQAIVDALGGPGVAGTTELQVTERLSGQNMSVDVSLGGAYVAGSTNPNQGYYWSFFDAPTNVLIAAADPSNPRIDVICVQVRDDAEDGSGNNDARIVVVTGTAAASPSVPTVPASCLILAQVLVGAAATLIANANITDRRTILPVDLAPQGTIVAGGDITAGDVLWANRVRATSAADVTLGSTQHGLNVGFANTLNVGIGRAGIQAANNGAKSTLNLNAAGGVVAVGADGINSSGGVSGGLTTITGSGGVAYVAHDTRAAADLVHDYALAQQANGDTWVNIGVLGGYLRLKHLGADVATFRATGGGPEIISALPAGTGTQVSLTGGNQLVKQTSSRRYKTKIRRLRNELGGDFLGVVTSLSPAAFQRKRAAVPVRHYGFIAEEVERVLPAAVNRDDQGRAESLDLHALVAVLTGALQELAAKVARLEAAQ